MDSFILRKAKQYLFDEGVFYDLENQHLKVSFKKADGEIELDFSAPQGLDKMKDLPFGMIAFIGHNGSGKSTLLYQLAKLMYAQPNDRFYLKGTIELQPNDVGISKLMMFSYSAFDNFMLPGITLSDYRLMAEGVENREGRFIYCGIRDIKAELEKIIASHLENKEDGEKYNPVIAHEERFEHICLKNVSGLAEEFGAALRTITQYSEKQEAWNAMAERCKETLPSLYEAFLHFSGTALLFDNDYEAQYKGLSTGVKFFFHTMSHLIAYNEDNSVMLFDEPENHLHPPMLSFMMSEIRRIIHDSHSVMLVATHSPVILQEMFAQNVYSMQKWGHFALQPSQSRDLR